MIRPFDRLVRHRALAPLALALLLAAALTSPALAGGDSPAAAALDPTVREVVHMLDGGVAEPVIDSWLASTGRRPARVDSAELVALQGAKASPELMKRLIQLAGGGTPAAPPAPAVAPAPAPEAPVPAAPVAAAAPSAPAPAAVVGSVSAGIPVRFQLSYRPLSGDAAAAAGGADDDATPGWDLFVYVDGRLLTWAQPAMISLTARTWSFDRTLSAGRHVVRLVQERHERRFGDHWTHAARVAPLALAFDLEPGGPWRVQLQLDQVKISRKGPLTLRASSGDREIAAAIGGGEAATWPPLCEEVEANVAEGKKPSAEARRQLAACVRWPTLFPDVAGVPPRAEVRADLARDGYRPPQASALQQ